MEKFLIKRASTSASASENKKRKLSETTTYQPINEELEEKKTLNVENQKKERKYQDQYIQFGFTFIEEKGKHRPKCVICLEILASESMKPSKLKRHLETKHPQYSNKDEQFFKRHENALKVQKKVINKFSTVSQKALVASFKVSYLITKTKKPHSIGESLVLPAAIKIVTAMHVMNEESIELSADENLRIKFNETTSDKFWISIKLEYPELSKVAVSTLLPFATT
ncbi:zinc finger BED domain-containing protein 5-like [Sipha flava]|uniref:Zinc finger BED domain-containing protein 5-like n=1 Tax=Sipha flava TaxID=143950 RepID=A0A8B8FYX8_9HEMI|nr:zinc finger BED domain-containing protein 5-like [Sipha flava]